MRQTSFSKAATFCCGVLLALAPGGASIADDQAAYELLEMNCFGCHGYGASEGSLALDQLLEAEPTSETRAQWEKVWKMVRQEFMPPVDAMPLEREDRKAIVRWVADAQLGVDFDHPDPGRVTMRRLNRMEYQYTVTDLFGKDFSKPGSASSVEMDETVQLSELLPPDDTAYGFDNIGDFQTLPPMLLNKYFEIAEYVVRRVIVVDGPWYPERRLWAKPSEAKDAEKKEDGELRSLEAVDFKIDEPGKYRLEVRFSLGGWQEYGGRYEFQFNVDDQEIAAATIDVGGQETHTFVHEDEFTPGEHSVHLHTLAIMPDSEGKLTRLRLRPRIALTGPISGDAQSFPKSHQRIFFQGAAPEETAARREYARAILEKVATQAFRRPVDDETLRGLTDLAMSEPDFERGVANGLVAILVSPRFLFRTELQPKPDDPSERHELDEFELASRLSYLLWLSLPDEELFRLAGEGRLREELPAQIERMMEDPKSKRFIEDFSGQWLRTRNVLMTPISRREQIDPYRGAMKRETEMLFEHLVREDRALIELLNADYTFVNEKLANYYGIDGVEGGHFRKVELPQDSKRGGLLTHGSFLVSTSNPDRTSPVKRGLFVLENLLATQPPPPPANIPALEDARVEGKRLRTVREQLEAHRADPACAACHAHFDPIGIALENYDIFGQWRDEQRGAKIDPSATTVTGEELDGTADLRDFLATNEERFYRCCVEKLMTYALGRGMQPFDSVTVDRITKTLMDEGGKFSTMLLAIVESPAFQMRRGDDDEPLPTLKPDVPEPPTAEERRQMEERRRERRRRFRERRRKQRAAEAAAAAEQAPEKSEDNNG